MNSKILLTCLIFLSAASAQAASFKCNALALDPVTLVEVAHFQGLVTPPTADALKEQTLFTHKSISVKLGLAAGKIYSMSIGDGDSLGHGVTTAATRQDFYRDVQEQDLDLVSGGVEYYVECAKQI